jgi:hypothetical protein
MPRPERSDCIMMVLESRMLFVFLPEVAAGVNGPLLHKLGKAAGHKDVVVVDVFRHGGDLVGKLACTGNGTPIADADAHGIDKRIAALTKGGDTSRTSITLKGLRIDAHAGKLLGIAQADAKLGRMSKPVLLTPSVFLQQDNANRCYSKAFTVEQGLKEDGELKVRAVYNFTGSGVNEATVPTEKLKCDALDALLALIKEAGEAMGVQLEMWKADIDSAFRRLPVKAAHRDLAWVAWRVDEKRMAIARHFAMPFGAIASVHYWDRIGSRFCLLCFLFVCRGV